MQNKQQINLEKVKTQRILEVLKETDMKEITAEELKQLNEINLQQLTWTELMQYIVKLNKEILRAEKEQYRRWDTKTNKYKRE